LRIVFFGSPEFALPALGALHAAHEIVLVVTQPRRPCGRGQRCLATPVECRALELGLPVITPTAVRTGGFAERLRALGADYLVVVAYGRILPSAVLGAARNGALNIHPSLLPRWRGPAPVPWTLYHGETTTGVSIMQMNEEMDAGDLVRQVETPVDPAESADRLLCRLAELGAEALAAVLTEEERSGVPLPRLPQDGALATRAPLITTELALIDWCRPATAVAAHLRAFDSRPGAYAFFGEDRIKFFNPCVLPAAAPAGTVLGLIPAGLAVACGEDAVVVGEMQWPGGRRMPAAQVLAGHPLPDKTVLRGRE
jgi:methionyl-tRNA formyltransferase